MSDKTLFYVPIKERYRINPLSEKKTYHIVLDLKDIDVEYQVGDCVVIYPQNPAPIVDKILSLLNFSGHETVYDKMGAPLSIAKFLSEKVNLDRVNPSLCTASQVSLSREERDRYDISLFLEKYRPKLSSAEFVSHVSPLIPRYYSIASSMKSVGKEAHLTIVLSYYEAQGAKKFGTCSYYLTQSAPLNLPVIPLYFDLNRDFTLSKESFQFPIIMVGPGTGIAPFLGFLQERNSKNCKNWLFFGERNKEHDFYYKDFLLDQVQQNQLKLDCAFSRDQAHKVYVQDKMKEHGQELWQWLQEGAFLFVCGDASRMAKDVEKTLHLIIKEHGSLNDEETKEYIKNLKRQKRYLRDVY